MAENWMEGLRGETVVVKFGGNAMIDDALARAFCEDIVSLQRLGLRIVVSHGGGPQISSELIARGIHSEFRGGLRVTTPEAMHVVREVLVRIGGELSVLVRRAGGMPAVVSGDEQRVFSARTARALVKGQSVDLGRVGDIDRVWAEAVAEAMDAGHIPIVSAIAHDTESGELLNVNADAAAGALAASLSARWLVLLTDVAGLYRDWPNRDTLISEVGAAELSALAPGLESGMIPKVAAALHAVRGGVGQVAIMDGRTPHALTVEPFGSSGTIVSLGERAMA